MIASGGWTGMKGAMWVALSVCLAGPRWAAAHCDTMDGPVVSSAKVALERGDATPVLKWVKPEYEPEVRAALARTLAVRKLSAEARDLADRYFFETVVRVHRLGEGESFTGIKPAGTDPGPAVAAADRALESGSVDAVVKLVTDATADGIRARFRHAREMRETADRSVEDGRAFVAAYVEFMHYVERLHSDAAAHAGHHHAASETERGAEDEPGRMEPAYRPDAPCHGGAPGHACRPEGAARAPGAPAGTWFRAL